MQEICTFWHKCKDLSRMKTESGPVQMNTYDSIMKALSDEDNHFRLPAHLDNKKAAHYLSFAPHDSSREPRLMFAFDNIEYDNDAKTWNHSLKVELFTIQSVRNMKDIPALRELEVELTADYLKNDLGQDYRTPSSWDIADMFLYFPRNALPRIRDIGQQKRSMLKTILDLNTPNRDPDATRIDFFCAYCLGNYIPSQLEGIIWNYLAESIYQGMEIKPIDDDGEKINSFYEELVKSYEYQDYDSWPNDLTPAEVMGSIVSFYNAFMRYRDLSFVKRRLENLIYDLENYRDLVRYCETN